MGVGRAPTEQESRVKVYFLFTKDKEKIEAWAREGESLLEVAHNNDVELEGACE